MKTLWLIVGTSILIGSSYALYHVFVVRNNKQTVAPTNTAESNPNTKQFLALGDSYTSGEGIAKDGRWPIHLVTQLRAQGIDMADPVFIARTGWTTADLDRAMSSLKTEGTFDLVSLLIGANDEFRGNSREEYRSGFVSLLQKAIVLAGGKPEHVLVLSVPDWGVSPYAASEDKAAIAASIDRYNAVNRAEAERLGARYIDITNPTRAAANDREIFAGDGLHYSSKTHARWAELAVLMAKNALLGK